MQSISIIIIFNFYHKTDYLKRKNPLLQYHEHIHLIWLAVCSNYFAFYGQCLVNELESGYCSLSSCCWTFAEAVNWYLSPSFSLHSNLVSHADLLLNIDRSIDANATDEYKLYTNIICSMNCISNWFPY